MLYYLGHMWCLKNKINEQRMKEKTKKKLFNTENKLVVVRRGWVGEWVK